jgi:hypothetical protein
MNESFRAGRSKAVDLPQVAGSKASASLTDRAQVEALI